MAMRRAAAMFLAMVFGQALPAQAESEEMNGFGPIKFGMTAVEALAALGGKGEWKSDRKLVYGFDWDAIGRKFEVIQHFRDDQASSVRVRHESTTINFHLCISDSLRIVSSIKEKYQNSPTIRQRHEIKLAKSGIVTDSYFFGFEADSYIEVTLELQEEPRKCNLTIWYDPPSAAPLPF